MFPSLTLFLLASNSCLFFPLNFTQLVYLGYLAYYSIILVSCPEVT